MDEVAILPQTETRLGFRSRVVFDEDGVKIHHPTLLHGPLELASDREAHPCREKMATPTQTFPCPFCGRRMGVRTEMLGRHVRCPHCSQVVLAPTVSTGTPAASPRAEDSKPAPVPPPAEESPNPFAFGSPPRSQSKPHEGEQKPKPDPVARPHDEPEFIFDQKKESPDSILSDESDSEDEVFSSKTGSKLPRAGASRNNVGTEVASEPTGVATRDSTIAAVRSSDARASQAGSDRSASGVCRSLEPSAAHSGSSAGHDSGLYTGSLRSRLFLRTRSRSIPRRE